MPTFPGEEELNKRHEKRFACQRVFQERLLAILEQQDTILPVIASSLK